VPVDQNQENLTANVKVAENQYVNARHMLMWMKVMPPLQTIRLIFAKTVMSSVIKLRLKPRQTVSVGYWFLV
jgi:hypothetical protein